MNASSRLLEWSAESNRFLIHAPYTRACVEKRKKIRMSIKLLPVFKKTPDEKLKKENYLVVLEEQQAWTIQDLIIHHLSNGSELLSVGWTDARIFGKDNLQVCYVETMKGRAIPLDGSEKVHTLLKKINELTLSLRYESLFLVNHSLNFLTNQEQASICEKMETTIFHIRSSTE